MKRKCSDFDKSRFSSHSLATGLASQPYVMHQLSKPRLKVSVDVVFLFSQGYAYQATVGGYTVGSSWTRGLVIHPIAAAVILVALLLSFSTHLTVVLVASLVSFLGCLMTLIVFAIDIALFAYVKGQMGNIGGSTMPGPAFWMTLVVLVLTAVAGCIVCFGRRRARVKDEGYTIDTRRPWYHKFRRSRV